MGIKKIVLPDTNKIMMGNAEKLLSDVPLTRSLGTSAIDLKKI